MPMVLLLLLALIQNIHSETASHDAGSNHNHNVVLARVLITESSCDNRYHNVIASGRPKSAAVYEAIKDGFPAGLLVTFQDDPSTPKLDFDVSLTKSGLANELLTSDFAGLKTKIINLLEECGDVAVDEVKTTFSGILPIPPVSEASVGRGEGPWLGVFNEGYHGLAPNDADVDSGSGSHKSYSNFEYLSEDGTTLHIPGDLDLSEQCGPIRNQGAIGACLAFSVDALFHYYEQRDNGNIKTFSPKYFYYHRDPENIGPGEGGMSPLEVGEVAHNYGVVEESLYPYVDVSEEEGDEVIPENIKEIGAAYGAANYNDEWICEVPSYHIFPDFKEHIKMLLTVVGPIVVSVPTHDHPGCDMWNSHGTEQEGGHAMTIIGYDSEGVRLRNSWDTDWCDGGYTDMTWIDAWERLNAFCYFETKKPKGFPDFNGLTLDFMESEDVKEDDCGNIHWGAYGYCGPDYGHCTQKGEVCSPDLQCTTDEVDDEENFAYNFPEFCAVGCDGILGSEIELDDCGVCGGDGSSCVGGLPMHMQIFGDSECTDFLGENDLNLKYDTCNDNLITICNEDNTLTLKSYNEMEIAVNAEDCADSLLNAETDIAKEICTLYDGFYIKANWDGDCNDLFDCALCEGAYAEWEQCYTEHSTDPKCEGLSMESEEGASPMELCVSEFCPEAFEIAVECFSNCEGGSGSDEEEEGFDCDSCDDVFGEYEGCRDEHSGEPQCEGLDSESEDDGPAPLDLCVSQFCPEIWDAVMECDDNCDDSGEEEEEEFDCGVCEAASEEYDECRNDHLAEPECQGLSDATEDGPSELDNCLSSFCPVFNTILDCINNCEPGGDSEEEVGFSFTEDSQLSPSGVVLCLLFSSLLLMFISFTRMSTKAGDMSYEALSEQEI